MKYGVSYYPEHRDEIKIDHEITLMVESGINIVRMGEFAWCKFEPKEGQYDFSWLDPTVEKLAKVGIDSIICTPTACPPAWIIEKHPEILYTDNRGVVRPFGGRRHYCYNNPIYREYSRKIAEEIGKHYGKNPNVFAFQIDNELAQEGTGRCHCQCCKGKFQKWLENKYTIIKSLNETMGTIFWGQEYDHFGQINMPINTIEVGTVEEIDGYYDNPSLRLDYERFCSESNTEYQDIQGSALKKFTDKIVTTNATGLATNSIDYYEAFKKLDRYAYDFYPSLRDIEVSSFSYSFGRGIKDSDFWLLEFISGGGHKLGNMGRLQPFPGALQQAAIHAFASGAELVAHFQFRTFPFGAEQLNYSILDLDGVPRRNFYEVKNAARDLKILEEVLENSKIENSVALCFDYDVLWATKIKPINKATYDYFNYCNEIYDTLVSMGIGVDVVSYKKELNKYKLVVVPAPFVMKEEFKVQLKEYVKNGGVLVSSFLAGAKNENNVGIDVSLPCGLTDLFGISISELEPVFESSISKIKLKAGLTGANKYWTEVLKPEGAEIIGTYEDTFRKGQGVISKNAYGKGNAYYIGTGLEKDMLVGVLTKITEELGLKTSSLECEGGIEVIERQYNGKTVYCIFNFLKQDSMVKLNKTFTDLLSGKTLNEQIVISPKGYLFIM